MSSEEHKTNHGNNWTNFYHDSLRLFGSSPQLVETFLLYIIKRREYKTSCFGGLVLRKAVSGIVVLCFDTCILLVFSP